MPDIGPSRTDRGAVVIRRLHGGYLSAEVPDEADKLALILITPEPGDFYTVRISGELIDLMPEAITAAMQMAFLEMRRFRACG